MNFPSICICFYPLSVNLQMCARAMGIMHKLKLNVKLKCSFQRTLIGRSTSSLFSSLQSAFLVSNIGHTKKKITSQKF